MAIHGAMAKEELMGKILETPGSQESPSPPPLLQRSFRNLLITWELASQGTLQQTFLRL